MPGRLLGGDTGFGKPKPAGTFTAVSAGHLHTCGVRTTGTAACWGSNAERRATPPTGTFTTLSAGVDHTCGMRTDGTAACWGNNRSGEATPPIDFG